MPLTRRRFVTTSVAAGASLSALGPKMPALAQNEGEDKPTVTVGSKNYAEQLIVGNMLALLLKDAGFGVETQLNLGGTIIAHEALVAGDLDTYVEYSGTGLIAVLGEELPDSSATPAATPMSGEIHDPAYEIVAREYPERFNVKWLKPWGFNNTFAIIVTQEFSKENNVTRISDLSDMAGDMTFAADAEFAVRPDGLPGLEEAYGFSFEEVQNVEIGLLYPSVADGSVDAAVASSTDGRIPALDLVVLEDDLNFFPPYHAAPVVRMDLLEQSPGIEDLFNRVAGQIDNETMQNMNYNVDEEGKEPVDVASTFLTERGLIDN